MKRKVTYFPRRPCLLFHRWVWFGGGKHYRQCKDCGGRQHITTDPKGYMDWDWMMTGQWDPKNPNYVENALTRMK